MENETLTNIQNVCDLIKQTNKSKFRKQDKINFAYQYWNISEEDITDLYNYLAENKSEQNKNLAKIIGSFMDSQDITSFKKFNSTFYNQSLDRILKVNARIKENGNWLSLYDLEKEFTQHQFHSSPIIYSYLTPSQNTVTIDKDKANNILGILMENDIPTAKIIVTSSFPYYAKDDMDTYIKSFQKRK